MTTETGTSSVIPAAIADYEIVRLLGSGNNGRYYLAKPPARLGISDEYVALKVFSGPASERAYELSVRELRAFAAVNSPHLVKVYDAVLNDSFAIATEYLPLGSLANPARPLSRIEVLSAVRDAAKALEALHEAGLAHGDLKPGNVLLSEDGAKVSDLGLARFLVPGSTLTGMTQVDSVEFLDPAILRGERPSRSSEVWSLGATLHKALAGTGMYGELPGSDPLLSIRKVITSKPQVSDSLQPREAELIKATLEPVGARLPSAQAVADRIDELLRG